jgi:hypothetical protein
VNPRAAFLVLAACCACLARQALAFPGVLVAKDAAARSLRASSIVVLRYRGVSVVTLSTEYAGPLTPFAFVVPVPPDVRASSVKTLRRGSLSRVEALTAPRFHLFYEQDPCDQAPLEQDWDEHLKANGPGFLASPGLPPLDKHYAVSNEISAPVTPTFKERESEFSYRDLAYTSPDKLRSTLAAAGYRIGDAPLALLAKELHAGDKLLLAEVALSHVELSADNHVELGGIRFASREPVEKIEEALGAENGGSPEDVFVYVFDRATRFELKNQENVRPPLAVRVEARVAEHLASAYDGLFDAVTARHPDAWLTEFAWPTSGCGEPCPDVPLRADELLTLGGDVLEAQTTTAKERSPEPGAEPTLERERFEEHLAELTPAERPAATREHAAERREIERRRALAARQTYVLTRLHHRYAAGANRRDLELAPVDPLEGGVGVPQAARGELSAEARAAKENRLEVRFYALKPWELGSACSAPRHFRWGKRWASDARAPRAVPLALDLAAANRDAHVLAAGLLTPLPELGLNAVAEAATPTPAPTSSAAQQDATKSSASKGHGCAVGDSPCGERNLAWLAAVCLGGLVVRRRT